MPRPKPGDPILSALFAEVPSGEAWEAGPRTAWLRMVEQRLNMKFGTLSAEGARIVGSDPTPRAISRSAPETLPPEDTLAFYIRPNGEVWCEQVGTHPHPVKFTDQKIHNRILYDQRTEATQGYDPAEPPSWSRTDTIVWADCGTRKDGALPPGVRTQQDTPDVPPINPGKEQGVLL